ncbi:tetratricopeptide repeat protein [Sphingomonas sp. 2378]|uniref:tetratricopeptide repeat protein n=1 Tax=Sphingomonas sp. 2378 TaxID=1219748 RepID=UPI00311AD09A
MAAVGVWIGAQTLGVYVARTDPRTAGSLNGSNAKILGLRSYVDLEAGYLATSRQLALKALRRDPTVVAAVQTLGLIANGTGDMKNAATLLAYAQRLSRRNLQTHLWAIEYHVTKGDVIGALDSYDRALRTSLAARDILFPVLGSAADDPAVAWQLAKRLGRKPLWYDAFLWFVGSDPQVQPATAVRLFVMATRAGVPLQPAALSALISRSLDAQQYDVSWAAYALLRPGADRSGVRDPSFRHLPDIPAAFDWTLASDGSIQAQKDGGNLEVEAGSGTTGIAVQQRQMLPPGRYKLTVDNDAVSPGGNLTWSITCQNGTQLTRLQVMGHPRGRSVSQAFMVPTNCLVQNLTLTVDASESPTNLEVVIKQVTIARL